MTIRFQRHAIVPAAASLGSARDLVETVLRSLGGATPLVDDAQLVTTELLSNAIEHADPPLELRLAVRPGTLVIEVVDHSPDQVPTLRPTDHNRINGRGLAIVAALATDWGVAVHPDHKVVWAELATDGSPTVSSPARETAVAHAVSDRRTPEAASPETP